MNIFIFHQLSFRGSRAYVDDSPPLEVAQRGQQQCMRLEGCRRRAARGGRVAGGSNNANLNSRWK